MDTFVVMAVELVATLLMLIGAGREMNRTRSLVR